MLEILRPLPWQRRALAAPPSVGVAALGGKAGGKTTLLYLFAVQGIEMLGGEFRGLYLRQEHQSCQEFVDLCRAQFALLYPGSRFNQNSRTFSGLPGGATFEINQVKNVLDFERKLKGRSVNYLACDEVGDWADLSLLEVLRSTLRAPKPIVPRVVVAGNPGGRAHAEIAKRFIFKTRPWSIFTDDASGGEWIVAPSTMDDNEHLDVAAYEKQIGALAEVDPALAAAWRHGDWTVARGAYFASVIEESRNLIEAWPLPERQPAGLHRRELVNELELF